MFLSRPTKDKGINIGICYSILQKCIRRCMTQEALYYGKLIFNDGTPNSLRKRLVQSCLEDMANLDLSMEILNAPDNKLFNYIQIVSNNKKTHISSWYQRVCLDHAIYKTKNLETEIEDGIKMHLLEKNGNYKEVRKILGKEYSKLYSFMNKGRLVWAVKNLWNNREELRYELDRTVNKQIKAKKFDKIPDWVLDKHVPNGTPGYRFFFENGCIMNNRIYQLEEPYELESKNIYYDEEKDFFGKSKTKSTIERWVNSNDFIPSVLLENRFRNIVQIQLLTRRNNPKVYFCTNFEDDKKYVLKGPLTKLDKERIELTEEIKKIIKFPHLNSKVITLSDEYWLISDSLVNYKYNVVWKESKLESNRPIYNGSNVNCCFDNFFGPNRDILLNQKNIGLAMLFKSLVGAKDYASRNFLVDNKVYSIDDHSYLPEDVDIHIFPDKIKKDTKKDWKQYIKNIGKKKIRKRLKKWKKRIMKSDVKYKDIIVDRLGKIISSFI